MKITGMLDTYPPKPKRGGKFIAGMFAAAITGALIGGGVAIVQHAPDAHAVSQVQINRFIRNNGGIPPCKWEDGSGQPGMCYWDGSEAGDGEGYDYVAVPNGVDKAIVWLTGPKAVRR